MRNTIKQHEVHDATHFPSSLQKCDCLFERKVLRKGLWSCGVEGFVLFFFKGWKIAGANMLQNRCHIVPKIENLSTEVLNNPS